MTRRVNRHRITSILVEVHNDDFNNVRSLKTMSAVYNNEVDCCVFLIIWLDTDCGFYDRVCDRDLKTTKLGHQLHVRLNLERLE